MEDQESYQKYRSFVQKNYIPLHKSLYSFHESFLAPSFREALQNPKDILNQISCIFPQIYSFELLSREFCTRMLEEARNFENWCVKNDINKQIPNTMNNYGVVLDDFGFYSMLQEMVTHCVMPISSLLFADVGGDSLDYHHGFVVEYALDKDTSLDFHVDASDVTLNVCLGNVFNGGELYFGGIRCQNCQQTPPQQDEHFQVSHLPGHAILHRGKHRHCAQNILSGERLNLILWCMSSKHQNQNQYDSNVCPDWCDWRKYSK